MHRQQIGHKALNCDFSPSPGTPGEGRGEGIWPNQRSGFSLGLVVLLVTATIAHAQPTTAPAAQEKATISRTIRLHYVPAQNPADSVNVGDVITVIMDSVAHPDRPDAGSWERAKSYDAMNTSSGARTVAFDYFDPATNADTVTVTASGPNANDILDETIARLRQLVAAQPHQLTPDQLHQRLKAIDDAFAASKDQLQKLWNIIGARDEVMGGIIKDKMHALILEKQQIEIDLRAKQARAAAVRQQINDLRQPATTQTSSDPVTQELQKAVKLRESALKLIETLQEHGAKRPDDVYAAKFALVDARTKLAEHQEAFSQVANDQLIERLTSDLIMTSIDQAELKARFAEVTSLLPPEDITQITQEQVDRLSAAYRPENVMHPQIPLTIKLGRQQQDLQSQRFGLLVKNIEVINPTTHP